MAHSYKQNETIWAVEIAAWDVSQDGTRLTDGMGHAKRKGQFHKADLLISLPLCTWSVWPRKIERHSTANWGKGQNKMIIKKCKSFKIKIQYNQFCNPQCTIYKKKISIILSTKKNKKLTLSNTLKKVKSFWHSYHQPILK